MLWMSQKPPLLTAGIFSLFTNQLSLRNQYPKVIMPKKGFDHSCEKSNVSINIPRANYTSAIKARIKIGFFPVADKDYIICYHNHYISK